MVAIDNEGKVLALACNEKIYSMNATNKIIGEYIMEKPIELIEMPFISDTGSRSDYCGVCGGCDMCARDIDHRVGYIAYVAVIF